MIKTALHKIAFKFDLGTVFQALIDAGNGRDTELSRQLLKTDYGSRVVQDGLTGASLPRAAILGSYLTLFKNALVTGKNGSGQTLSAESSWVSIFRRSRTRRRLAERGEPVVSSRDLHSKNPRDQKLAGAHQTLFRSSAGVPSAVDILTRRLWPTTLAFPMRRGHGGISGLFE